LHEELDINQKEINYRKMKKNLPEIDEESFKKRKYVEGV
jgi:hypothetical protein